MTNTLDIQTTDFQLMVMGKPDASLRGPYLNTFLAVRGEGNHDGCALLTPSLQIGIRISVDIDGGLIGTTISFYLHHRR